MSNSIVKCNVLSYSSNRWFDKRNFLERNHFKTCKEYYLLHNLSFMCRAVKTGGPTRLDPARTDNGLLRAGLKSPVLIWAGKIEPESGPIRAPRLTGQPWPLFFFPFSHSFSILFPFFPSHSLRIEQNNLNIHK